MVTLRRDIAAQTKKRAYGKGQMTAYDLYMERKEAKYRAAFNDNSIHSMENVTYAADFYHDEEQRMPQKEVEEFFKARNQRQATEKPDKIDGYKAYLVEQLNRETPETLLSMEEYYKQKFQREQTVKAKKVRGTKIRLTKNVKIFITVYVLVVAIIASIIIAVNKAPLPNADASSAVKGEVKDISSMTIDEEQTPTNWFDKLMDGVSNA